MGDDIQAIKAGVLEIADLLVVNKADLAGADRAVQILEAALALGPRRKAGTLVAEAEEPWDPPILRTVASTGQGVEEVARQILRHAGSLQTSGRWADREWERLAAEIESGVRQRLADRWRQAQPDGLFEKTVSRVARREISPTEAIQILLREDATGRS